MYTISIQQLWYTTQYVYSIHTTIMNAISIHQYVYYMHTTIINIQDDMYTISIQQL